MARTPAFPASLAGMAAMIFVPLLLLAPTRAQGGAPATSATSTAASTAPSSPRLTFRLVDDSGAEPDANVERLPDRAGGPAATLRVERAVQLDESSIASARPMRGSDREQQVGITFTDAGAQRFSELTGANIGRRLAIVLDGRVISAPTIRSRIGREAVISGGPNGFTEGEVRELLEALGAGSTTATTRTAPAPTGR